MKLIRLTLVLVHATSLAVTAFGNDLAFLEKRAVYIECTTPGQPVRKGSGVIVSEGGFVLTAKHVVTSGDQFPPNDGTECKGARGNAKLALDGLSFGLESPSYDAVTLRLPTLPGQTVEYLTYCKLDDSHRRKTIEASGFPGSTKTGVLSSRVGILSTVRPDGYGLIESDSATTGGMSGGMVTLLGGSSLVGIIAGAQFDPGTGAPAYFGVLRADQFASSLGLTVVEGEKCQDETGFTFTEEFGADFYAGGPTLKLGVKADEGICFLTKIWGSLKHEDDMVGVSINDDGEYVLSGTDSDGSNHGGFAQCIKW